MNKILMKSMISFFAYARSEVSGPSGIPGTKKFPIASECRISPPTMEFHGIL